METQGALSFTELVLNASFLVQLVMFFLLALSVISWTIIFSRISQYRLGRAKADEFEDRFWSGIDLNNLYLECMKRPDELVGLEVIYSAGFKEFVRLVNSGPADQDVVMDGTYRQMKVACSREVELLENHLPTLATIGSISPYIGLFGTVWGIMHAFVALAAVKNATLAMVAPPIAEALIATAMGLFAAIPAVMFYNRFVTKVEALENRYYNFMDEFSTILNRRLVTIRSQLNRTPAQGQSQHNQGAMNVPGNSSGGTVNGGMAAMNPMNMQQLAGPGVAVKPQPGGFGVSGGNGAGSQESNSDKSGGSTHKSLLSSMRNKFAQNRSNTDMNAGQAQDLARNMRPNQNGNGQSGGATGLNGASGNSGAVPNAVMMSGGQNQMPSGNAQAGAMGGRAALHERMHQNNNVPVLGGNASLGSIGSARGAGMRGGNGRRMGPNDTDAVSGMTADNAQAMPNMMTGDGYRGVVPPRSGSGAVFNAQIPGGALKPGVAPNNAALGAAGQAGAAMVNPGMGAGMGGNVNAAMGNNMPGGNDSRWGKGGAANGNAAYDEPHYITPGGQNARRNHNNQSGGSGPAS